MEKKRREKMKLRIRENRLGRRTGGERSHGGGSRHGGGIRDGGGKTNAGGGKDDG